MVALMDGAKDGAKTATYGCHNVLLVPPMFVLHALEVDTLGTKYARKTKNTLFSLMDRDVVQMNNATTDGDTIPLT